VSVMSSASSEMPFRRSVRPPRVAYLVADRSDEHSHPLIGLVVGIVLALPMWAAAWMAIERLVL
jgi:hypothetical protein